jgi:hypothetical protein
MARPQELACKQRIRTALIAFDQTVVAISRTIVGSLMTGKFTDRAMKHMA